MNTNLSYQLKWAWLLTKNSRGELLLYFILELAAIAFSLLFVFWSKKAVDFAVSSSTSNLQKALILSVCSVLIALFMRSYSGWLNEKTRMKMMISLQNSLVKSQMLSTWKVGKHWHTGDIQVRINNDCQEIVQMVGFSSISFVLTTIRLLASFGFLWLMDPMLAILIVAISPLFLFSKIYFKKLRKLNKDLKTAESKFGNVVQENLRFRMSIRALGVQYARWQKVENSQNDIFKLKLGLLNFSTVSQGIMKLTINAGFLLTFGWGVYRLHANEISFGTMTAFLQLVGRIQAPILLMMGFVPLFIRFRTAVDRVQELEQVEVEQEIEQEYITEPQNIEINQLSFRYDDKLVIKDLSAKFITGQPVAIIGSSGKGKTTLIRLLLALIKPDKGEIYINTSTEHLVLSNKYRINIAYVPQGDKLFSGSIKENLQLGEQEVSDSKLREVLYLACAEFVYDLPDGLDTIVGESGYGLSEGQAQRIAVARALMRECNIWLFDEVTSALDPDTGEKLIQRLLEAGKNKILVFVTHDMKLAGKCEQTIYI
ncbi:ABC transporter ATP-binding protein [Elizabethkingia anophelis]|uniref:ABC transporter n=1 Tax=Elizabethkingia anophelis TaxID=1117645 RepID=A0AAU8V7R8_9FLAO|nr:ABC transporter ATP-binding protein [Elizabethkingia anophelis]AQW94508.1 ABC transporter [Elizabethkingia anophelis]AQX00723.1 ABC transporter [Elizabethkingia anophelis]MCL1033059.1 ABC transporter ATP-binding protein/permease [Elizabethkingia anophelis]MCW2462826.1 ABC-type bacteriocin/lantibiotic exporter with double-glycine peptidase domain [Elizabethkingia anophelis]MCW2466511.1 ABC-type bacteriocin/lantibiotic exporter with double-glycine peptidase domain [Elizabethkingia anophelis]